MCSGHYSVAFRTCILKKEEKEYGIIIKRGGMKNGKEIYCEET